MEQRRWGKEDNIPLTEDILTLQNYLEKIENEAKAELKEHASTAAYKKLCESLLAQIIVFNKKREGEASRLTLETYQRADTGPLNKDIYDTLSPVEQQLSHKLTRLVTRGKRGRKVPVLLLERTKASLDVLIENRTAAGVRAENPFLFARPGTNSNFRGCDCLRKFAEESKAKHPELLRSTKLRKHVATLCQLLKLDNQELEQVARFMGHDIRVHCRRSATLSSRSLRGDDLARDSEDHYDEEQRSSSNQRPMKSNKKNTRKRSNEEDTATKSPSKFDEDYYDASADSGGTRNYKRFELKLKDCKVFCKQFIREMKKRFEENKWKLSENDQSRIKRKTHETSDDPDDEEQRSSSNQRPMKSNKKNTRKRSNEEDTAEEEVSVKTKKKTKTQVNEDPDTAES
ncbi:hypothetical protein WMY93_033011 [Mugilogobius chulae]|uniref:Uncharacterized protein n=1 Tax=Mugilogobius chulae TaxID=88201 RepID=A0AAW0MJS7_9GOBI